MIDPKKEKLNQLIDYIMKHCLWQFHSRAWDRERQNKEILSKTKQLLLGEPVKTDTPEDKCYWADAVCLAEAFKSRYLWLLEMKKDEIEALMKEVKDRMDLLTISGSLNKELVDPRY
ncbi:Fe-only nitrogenase, delta subunit [Clostridium sp. DL-VIII]|uniref:Fe-only nitrogenase subunit delta n=1 Tax=Clostridium sp. DL-VIII TaxID=641107 RepID=UPI00023B04B3|nr:Fe-only nitrogenase subunit delta [Clostridium sp. DL-VIII]EHJ00771.1 Fe-only nitrogenase, delta subunit [Clostridium sp. DL-VIII]